MRVLSSFRTSVEGNGLSGPKAKDGQDTIIDELVGDFGGLTGGDFEAVFSGTPQATGL